LQRQTRRASKRSKEMNKAITTLLIMATISVPLTAGAAYKVVDVNNGGSVTGKVTFSGEDPAPKSYLINKDPEVCGSGQREIDFVKVNNGALNDAVVYLDKIKSGKAFSKDLDNPVIDQKKCAFNPFMGVMKNEDTITVKNSDATLHNIHTYEIIGRAKKTVFNISQPSDVKTINKKVKLRRGTAMKVECDAHDFMHGFRFVTKSPYFSVVKADGSFVIDNIPPGEYTIKAWHGTLGEQKGKVKIDAGGKATIDFTFKGK